MPTELEYYETEFTDSYKAAVDKLIKKEDINYNKYLSNDYKLEKIKLTFLEKVNIIYYYSGFKSATIVNFSDMKKAILKIIEFSELECETISEKFDYFSIRLMARKLNVSEFNFLYKKYNNLIKMKTENESLYIIFLDIMNFDDCNYR